VKEFICVTCWGAFRAEEADKVVCPLCGVAQPAGTVPAKPARLPAPKPDDKVITEEDLARPETAAKAPPQNRWRADTAPTDIPESLRWEFDTAGGPGAPRATPPPASAAVGDVMPSQALLDELYERATEDFKVSGAEAPHPVPQVAPPTPDPSASGVVMSWRLRLSSGLVLSFPSIEMVSTYASDKRPDQLALSHGDGRFVSYLAFMEALREGGDPLVTMAMLGGGGQALGLVGVSGPPPVRPSSDPRSHARPMSDSFQRADPAAVAAAQGARARAPVLETMTHHFKKGKNGAAPADRTKRLMLFGIGLLFGVVLVILIIQGL
jgi:hypothetical protein